jgi:hypothetical protein
VSADRSLSDEIAERRKDQAFMDRLAQRMHEDAGLMERLKDGECRTARLVESREGGAILVYECEQCGARLTRTKAQAEADARGSR